MKKKKSLFVLVAMLLTLSMILAACGGNKNNGASESPSASVQPSATASESPSADAGTKIAGDFEIQYFVGGYGDVWWKSMIAKFKEKYPDVNVIESAGPKINDQMKPRWIQGSPPDLVYLDGENYLDVGTSVKDGLLMDLTDWYATAMNDDGMLLKDQLITQPQLFDGKVYSIPLVFGSWGTFYNKSLFTNNGWEVPTDFDSFLVTAEKAKAAGIAPYTHPGIYTGYFVNGFLLPGIVSANGDDLSILDDIVANTAGVYESAPVQKALEQVVSMQSKGLIDKAAVALNHTDSQLAFLQERNAFIPNGLWLPNEMANDTPDGFEFGYIPSVTQAAGGKYVSIPYFSPFAIAEKAKNPEAAKAFIQFVYTEANAVEWAEATGALMNLKVDLEGSSASSVSKEAVKYYSSPNLIVAPPLSFHPDVDKELKDATLSLTDGKINPAQWTERMEAAAAKAAKDK